AGAESHRPRTFHGGAPLKMMGAFQQAASAHNVAGGREYCDFLRKHVPAARGPTPAKGASGECGVWAGCHGILTASSLAHGFRPIQRAAPGESDRLIIINKRLLAAAGAENTLS